MEARRKFVCPRKPFRIWSLASCNNRLGPLCPPARRDVSEELCVLLNGAADSWAFGQGGSRRMEVESVGRLYLGFLIGVVCWSV